MRSDQDLQTAYRGQIQAGWDVYGSDGEKIGSVAPGESEPGAQYFVVEKGFFFPTELYIPFSAISQVDDEQIYLSVTKDEVEGQGWDAPPETTTDEGDIDAAVAGYRERSAGENVLERREERLQVDTQPAETGEVRVGKHVVEEEQSVDVPVSRQQAEIDRRSVDRPAAGPPRAEGEISVPLTEERVVASKEPRVVEELEVDTVTREDTERVNETVRKEQFDIERESERHQR